MYNLNLNMKGHYSINLVSPSDEILQTIHQDNVILNNGFNQLLSGLTTGYIYVGSSSVAEDPTQAGLISLLHKGQITSSNWRNTSPVPPTGSKKVINLNNGEFSLVSTADLGFGSFVGTVNEVGFRFNADVPTNLFSRTVLSSPITVPSGYKLIVTYTLSITAPTVEVVDNFTLRDTTYTYTIRPNISNIADLPSVQNQGGITYFANDADTHFFNYGFTQVGSTVKLENARFTYETDVEYTNSGNNTNYRLSNTLASGYTMSINSSNFYIQYAFNDLYKTETGTNPNVIRTPDNIKALGFPFCSGLPSDGSLGSFLPAYIVEFEPALNSSDFRYAGNFRITFNK